jgi:hypothetical protein
MATIRIAVSGRSLEVTEPCFGFDCSPGTPVPVTVLPSDVSVRVAGSLKEQLWTALTGTLLVLPLMFGGGVAYSISRLSEARQLPAARHVPPFRWLRYTPVVMSVGVLLSSAINLSLGNQLTRLQLPATACLVAGSAAYLASLRGSAYRGKKIPLILTFVLFGAGFLMLAIDSISLIGHAVT